MSGGVEKIAMLRRDGTLKAEAIVDSDDYEWLSQYRWNLSGQGRYAARKEGNRSVYMHREIMGVTSPKIDVDHINGDRLDNRRDNLRVVSRAQNMQNAISVRPNRFSQHRGVTRGFKEGTWQAQVHMAGKNYFLGTFDDEEDAAAAAAAFRAKYMPFSSMDVGRESVAPPSRRPKKQRHHPYIGVTIRKSAMLPWRARVSIAQRRISVGNYATAEEAARAYDRKARELLGNRARLNFPDE